MKKWSYQHTRVVPKSVATDVGAVEEAEIIQTPEMVGVALARQLWATVFQQSVEERAQGARVTSKGNQDLVYGMRVQLAAKSLFLQCY